MQRKYVQGIAKGKSTRDALRYAGYSEKSNSYHIHHSKAVQEEFRRVFQEVRPRRLLKVMEEALDANKTSFASVDGRFTDRAESPDFPVRIKAAELIAKFGNQYVPELAVTDSGAESDPFSIIEEILSADIAGEDQLSKPGTEADGGEGAGVGANETPDSVVQGGAAAIPDEPHED